MTPKKRYISTHYIACCYTCLLIYTHIYTIRLYCVGMDLLTFYRSWRHRNFYVFTKRQEIGTTIFGPGVVAKVIAVAQRVQYRYGTVVLSAFATTPRPGRTVPACQVGTVFVRRRATQRHHHYSGYGGRRRHL